MSQLKQTLEQILKSNTFNLSGSHMKTSSIKTLDCPQEIQYSLSLKLQNELFNVLNDLNSEGKIKSELYNNIAKKTRLYAGCLLNYAENICEILENNNVEIMHKCNHSQSVLLAGYLCSKKTKVTIITSKDYCMKWEHLIIKQNQVDPSGFINACLEKENISVLSYKDQSIEKVINDPDQIVIYDVFGISSYSYEPYLLRYLTQQKKNKTILYYSYIQDQQFQSYHQHSLTQGYIPAIISFSHPIQTLKNDKVEDNSLVEFLREERNHPKKQSIIIFYLNNSSKNYYTKLTQLLNLNGLHSSVQIINSKIHQTLPNNKNIIFLAKSTKELQSWNYNYENVFYVIDYGYQQLFYFDYQTMSYVEGISYATQIQLKKRLSYVGNYQVGRYYYPMYNQESKKYLYNNRITQVQYLQDISQYCYEMVLFGFKDYLNLTVPRIKQCLSSLEKAKIIQLEPTCLVLNKQINDLKIESNNVFHKNIFTKIKSYPKRLQNLLVMIISCICTPGSLRKEPKLEVRANKPQQIWRWTGYIHSAAIALCKLEFFQRKINGQLEKQLEEKLSVLLQKKTSKISQNVDDPFGHLYNLYDNVDDMPSNQNDYAKYIKANSINEDVLNQIKDRYQSYRSVLQIPMCTIIDLEWKDIQEVLIKLLQANGTNGTALYSGSSRIGYITKGFSKGIYPHKSSLLALLSERPSLIFIIRLSQIIDKKQILMTNTITHNIYMEVFGQLPEIDKKVSQTESELEFHGISSAVFEGLWRTHGRDIQAFQKENGCIVDKNEEVSLIRIYCSHKIQAQVKQKFQALLKKFKDQLLVSTKVVNYIGNTNLVLGGGGQTTQVIKDKYITKCKVSNLSVECTQEDLYQLFSQFFLIKKIQIMQTVNTSKLKNVQPSLHAIIQLHSQRDFYTFRLYFNQCTYMDRVITVTPIQGELEATIDPEMYLRAKWFVWKSLKKGMVEFQTEQSAHLAHESIVKNPQFGGEKGIISRIEGAKLYLQGLSEKTDEIFLYNGFVVFGKIRHIEILKIPVRENNGEDQLLHYHIHKALNNVENINFKIHPIKKKKNGLRSAKITFKIEPQMLNAFKLNDELNIIGYGGIHFSLWYNHPILVAHSSTQLYKELLEEDMKEFGNTIIMKILKTKDKKKYIILKSSNKNSLAKIVQQFTNHLAGHKIKLPLEDNEIVLSEIGLTNIMDLQEKYNCKFVPDIFNKCLKVIVSKTKLKKIEDEIKERLSSHFHYRISLNTKTVKHFTENQQKYLCLKQNNKLTQVQFDKHSKYLILEGSALNIQSSLNYLMNLIQSLSKPQDQMVNADSCLICCEDPKRPYRLQNCGHSFCMKCVMETINAGLGDVSMFPLKCPHCLQLINIGDLQVLIDKATWPKLLTMSINKYIGTHSEFYTFCFTAGCKQISRTGGLFMKCDVCRISYCFACKELYHPDLTCQEAKMGTEQLFQKFMNENNIRKCPFKSCGMPIERTDGCYRVTCSRCNKSMCFKCDADKMIAYDNYNDCYSHLTAVHGGYW